MKARKIVIQSLFQGVPKLDDFKIVEEELPELKNGEILAEASWHSVDPYMRKAPVGLGDIMPGRCIATIVESKNSRYPKGTNVIGNFGWRDKAVYKPEDPTDYDHCYALPDMKGLPLYNGLGAVGRVGNTAYHGLLKVCELKDGETLAVSGAAGAVGSLVGQIGKIKDCNVIGIAGTREKCQWLLEHGFDHAINYKTDDIDAKLKAYAPQGIDSYFDNVAGEISYHVMNNMNVRGRVALCGAISSYNAPGSGPFMVPVNYHNWIYKQLRIEAFAVSRFKNEKDWLEGMLQMRDWIAEGKIKTEETIDEGFEKMPQAFIKLFTGENLGKMIVSTNKLGK